jgi:replicative DNA helicase
MGMAQAGVSDDRLSGLTDGRLDVTDIPYQAEQLPALIASLNAYPPRAILLDYIQKIPLEGRGAARYLDLQAVSATLLGIAIEHNVALVIGSQLNADGLTREARDISFDASLMIRLKPVEVEKGQPDFPPNATEMDAIIDKNRQGWQGKFLLVWDKPSRRMARKLFDKSRVSSGLK